MKTKNLKMTDDDALRIIKFLIVYLNWGKVKKYILIEGKPFPKDWGKLK